MTTRMSPRSQTILMGVLPIFFLVLSVLAQIRTDRIVAANLDLHEPVHRFILPASVVKYGAFGFQNVLADYYWVTAIQDLNKWDRRDEYYPEYFRIMNALDPKFMYPYFFGILTVPSRQNPESLSWISEISALGMEVFPENWEIPFYTGMQYHTIGRSNEDAVRYLEIAAKKPSRPEVVETTYALFLFRSATDRERSRALFTAIIKTTDNAETKKIAEDRIALLDFIEMVDNASISYKGRHGYYPDSLETLAEEGFVRLPTDLVKRFRVGIDPVSGRSTFK